MTALRWILIVVLLGIGAWQLASAAYFPMKAVVAQQLLGRAWDRTLAQGAGAPWPWADFRPVARLRLPGQDADYVVLDTARGSAMAFGPGHVDGSAMPGDPGTSVISGHRDTHFAILKDIHRGDAVELQDRSGTWHRYVVQDFAVIDTRRQRLALTCEDSCLMLVTCYPFDALLPGGPLRFVAVATEPGEAPDDLRDS
jgi:sortase A